MSAVSVNVKHIDITPWNSLIITLKKRHVNIKKKILSVNQSYLLSANIVSAMINPYT